MHPFPQKAKPPKSDAFALPAVALLSPDVALRQESQSYSSYSALKRNKTHTAGMMGQQSRRSWVLDAFLEQTSQH